VRRAWHLCLLCAYDAKRADPHDENRPVSLVGMTGLEPALADPQSDCAGFSSVCLRRHAASEHP
jgi:hypothetical protein